MNKIRSFLLALVLLLGLAVSVPTATANNSSTVPQTKSGYVTCGFWNQYVKITYTYLGHLYYTAVDGDVWTSTSYKYVWTTQSSLHPVGAPASHKWTVRADNIASAYAQCVGGTGGGSW